jgi:hypothetical protein
VGFGLNGAAYARLATEILLTIIASFAFYHKLKVHAAA